MRQSRFPGEGAAQETGLSLGGGGAVSHLCHLVLCSHFTYGPRHKAVTCLLVRFKFNDIKFVLNLMIFTVQEYPPSILFTVYLVRARACGRQQGQGRGAGNVVLRCWSAERPQT